jgi:hypothetical protein
MSSIDKLLLGLKKRVPKINGELSLTCYWHPEIPICARKNINLTLV